RLDFKIIGLVILSYGTFLGIIAAHSYFYGSGQNGSMGLTRITTQGLPSFILVNLFLIGSIFSFKKKLINLFTLVVPILIGILLVTTSYLHKGESRINRAVLATGDYIKNEKLLQNKNIYAYHPLLSYVLESNLKMKNQRVKQFYGNDFKYKKQKLSYGDVVVWDSQFGPFELTVPFENMMNDSNLMLVHQQVVPGALDQNGVFIFQYVPAHVKKKNKSHFVEKTILSNKQVNTNVEYNDVLKIDTARETYVLRITCEGEKDISLICVPTNNSDYQGVDLHEGEMSFEFTVMKGLPYSVYVWNPFQKEYQLTINQIIERKLELPKLWSDGPE
ncbi:MAG: hypothetical protein ACSHXL_05405, partial [Bacteroidota bacterium]